MRSPQANRVIGELRDERLFGKRGVDNQYLKPAERHLLPGWLEHMPIVRTLEQPDGDEELLIAAAQIDP